MRKLILLGTLCYISTCTLAQSIDSLIEIKGFYVKCFFKQEVVFEYEQKNKEERGESYQATIGYREISFFVPIQVGNNVICEKDRITDRFTEKIINYYSTLNDFAYVIPDRITYDFLKKRNIVTTDVSKEICIMNLISSFYPYYEIEGNK